MCTCVCVCVRVCACALVCVRVLKHRETYVLLKTKLLTAFVCKVLFSI